MTDLSFYQNLDKVICNGTVNRLSTNQAATGNILFGFNSNTLSSVGAYNATYKREYLWEFVTSATQISLLGKSGNTSGNVDWTYRIDGGAEQTLAGLGVNVYGVWPNLYTGAPGTPHLIQIRPTPTANPASLILEGIRTSDGSLTLLSRERAKAYFKDNLASISSDSTGATGTSPLARRGAYRYSTSTPELTTNDAGSNPTGNLFGGEFECSFVGTQLQVMNNGDNTFWFSCLNDGVDQGVWFSDLTTFGNVRMWNTLCCGRARGSTNHLRFTDPGPSTNLHSLCLVRVHNGTNLATDALAGQAIINVRAGTGTNYAANDWLMGIGSANLRGQGGANIEPPNQIASVSTDQITLVNNLVYNHRTGEPVNGYADSGASISAYTFNTLSAYTILCMGHSYVHCAVGDTSGVNAIPDTILTPPYVGYDTRYGWPFHLRQKVNANVIVSAQQGTLAGPAANNGTVLQRVNNLVKVVGANLADHVIIDIGVNEINTSVTIGDISTSGTFIYHLYQICLALQIFLPGIPIWFLKQFAPIGNGAIASYNAAIQTAVAAAVGAGCNALYVDASQGVNIVAGQDVQDTKAHPRFSGSEAIAVNLAYRINTAMTPGATVKPQRVSLSGGMS